MQIQVIIPGYVDMREPQYVCIRDDHNIKRLKQFVNVEYIWDKEDLLGDKDSPVDRGQDTWKKLYDGRLSWR